MPFIPDEQSDQASQLPTSFIPDQPVAQGEQSFLSKLGNAGKAVSKFVMPRMTNVAEQAGTGLALGNVFTGESKASKDLQQSKKQSDEMSRKLIQAAQMEQDPQKKAELLKVAREAQERTSGVIQNFVGSSEKGMNLQPGQNPASPIRQGIGVAGEAGVLLSPVKAPTIGGGSLLGSKLLSKIAGGAVLGATAGTITGATDPNVKLSELPQNSLIGGLTGGVVGGGTTAAVEIPKSLVKKILTAAPNTIMRLFRPSNTSLAKFNRNTKMNFQEEILKRDGAQIAGKDYPELVTYFQDKSDAANKVVDNKLASSDKTISRSWLVKQIEDLEKKLNPKENNVGTTQAINGLKSIKNDLNAGVTTKDLYLPGGEVKPVTISGEDAISLSDANKIKRQLQQISQESYSVNGKSSISSDATADVAGLINDEIERIYPGIKQDNKVTQLYRLALDSIKNTSNTEAKKLSNDMLTAIANIIPITAATGIGVGTGNLLAGLGAGATLYGAKAGREFLESPQTQTKFANATYQGAQKYEQAASSKAAANATKVGQFLRKIGTIEASRATTSNQEPSE